MAAIKVTGLDMRKWRETERKLKELGGVRSVRVGILPGSRNADGENIAEYAAANEYGTADIPSRPFMRTTAREKGFAWAGVLAGALRGRTVKDPNVGRRAFTAVGRVAQADIQATIMSNMPPANSPEYAAEKVKENGGYAGTLFLSGDMHKSINFELVTGAGESAE